MPPKPMPSLFVSHGAPTLYLEPQPTRAFLMELGKALPRPKAVVCVSAHWTTAKPMLTTAASPGTMHDFGGFPEALFAVRYPASGHPALAGHLGELLAKKGITATYDPQRGLDHGAWVPLGLMYPEADIPVVQLSVQPERNAAHHLAMGEALASLRQDGVLVVASGSATHNLRGVRWDAPATPPPDYVVAFDAWLKEGVLGARTDILVDYPHQAPFAFDNHPTPEHLLPLFVPLGMGGKARLLHDHFTLGVLSMAAFAWE
ncbi:DODA-type extradiol aromatic ring-opening family dioxygenase [Desulfovibrio sp. TomC]|uniref:DODA-type extradiol aromatic ring-opening family dioxygenase n=1 Tax=Desulfovibrio sp. TomC TaxID=1562888 RepID=UPI00069E0091|nr:class III extradiol ring-cleavage dioxygenase [Desulfovibrio sp. TomC]